VNNSIGNRVGGKRKSINQKIRSTLSCCCAVIVQDEEIDLCARICVEMNKLNKIIDGFMFLYTL
jgi:hypothetical protein